MIIGGNDSDDSEDSDDSDDDINVNPDPIAASRTGKHVPQARAYDDDSDDDDDALAVFDGTDAVQFDGRVRQHGELTFTPQSEL